MKKRQNRKILKKQTNKVYQVLSVNWRERKEELENLKLNMEKQLQQTEDIINMMTERKTKLENNHKGD